MSTQHRIFFRAECKDDGDLTNDAACWFVDDGHGKPYITTTTRKHDAPKFPREEAIAIIEEHGGQAVPPILVRY